MSLRYLAVYCLFALVVFSATYCANDTQSENEKIARSYCGSCHLFPEPSLLDKKTWEKGVLPKMAVYFGIAYYGNSFYVNNFNANAIIGDSNRIKSASIGFEKWSAIIDYYTSSAPENLDSQNRPPIRQFTNRFIAKEGLIKGSKPTTTYVQIDPGNKHIYTSNESDSLFSVFDPNLNLLSKKNIHKVIVDAQFSQDILRPGKRSGVLTNIGIIHPNDLRTGTLEQFTLDSSGKNIAITATIANKLPRPVQTAVADFDNDGKMDYLICGFGYNTGEFYYLHNLDSNHYERETLKGIPGAIKAYIDDYNKDGLPDIVVLFAQAQEGVYVYLNKGKGNFEIKELLRFPSVYGSTYFEYFDINGDGLKDILYTCGDNLDFSQILKNYHGIYIYLNKGNDHFEKAYFFPLHGCYKAIMRDYDNDGDLDIAAISYFPDAKHQPQESFVYLENKGGFNFAASTIKGFNRGNWVTMDAGDVDGDGDDDIIIGSLIFNNTPRELTIGAGPGDLPNFLLLVNQTK